MGLLITDPGSAPVRVTRDVDVIAEVATYAQYTVLADRLRAAGFHEDLSEGAPVCRWIVDSLLLDVMPVEGRALGFTNTWYKAAVREAQTVSVGAMHIRLITAPLFLATKLEAFADRGNGDYLASPDFEDIIAVVDGRDELAEEVSSCPRDVRRFLNESAARILADERFRFALAGHFLTDSVSQARAHVVLERLRAIARLEF